MRKRDVTQLALDELRSVDECIECATVDAYTDEEAASGWFTCIEEIFGEVREVKLGDEVVRLEKFDLSELSVVACCRKGKKRIRVTLDSLEFVNPTRAQKLWLEAWQQWSGR